MKLYDTDTTLCSSWSQIAQVFQFEFVFFFKLILYFFILFVV